MLNTDEIYVKGIGVITYGELLTKLADIETEECVKRIESNKN